MDRRKCLYIVVVFVYLHKQKTLMEEWVSKA